LSHLFIPLVLAVLAQPTTAPAPVFCKSTGWGSHFARIIHPHKKIDQPGSLVQFDVGTTLPTKIYVADLHRVAEVKSQKYYSWGPSFTEITVVLGCSTDAPCGSATSLGRILSTTATVATTRRGVIGGRDTSQVDVVVHLTLKPMAVEAVIDAASWTVIVRCTSP